MDQVSIKYTDIFHCKTLQNLHKFGFLVWKQTIWQPCPVPHPTTSIYNATNSLARFWVKIIFLRYENGLV
jgi:hypothetical protein